jgi:hypothetical protein
MAKINNEKDLFRDDVSDRSQLLSKFTWRRKHRFPLNEQESWGGLCMTGETDGLRDSSQADFIVPGQQRILIARGRFSFTNV